MTGERPVLTVSQLSAELTALVEARFPAVWVEGEISNFKVYASGHAYFTLKDAEAQLRCALFRTRARRLRFEPADGLSVLAFGSVEVYAPRGEYHLVVELLEPRGLGALQLAFEQLRARLGAEGLFDAARKRPLPAFPRKIGIVTSPSGAALRDILRVLSRRFAGLHVVLAPCRVQGDGAAEEIARALADLDAMGDVDVIIAGRGGGSLEDLWAFNEEVVARAIAASKAPVVAAVGHEVDVTIADFVADLRAPTPSAAAELVVREKQAVAEAVAALRRRLVLATGRGLAARRERLDALARRRVLTDPSRPLRDLARRVDDARARLGRGVVAALGRAAHRVELARQGLHGRSPVARAAAGGRQVDHARARLGAGMIRALTAARHRLQAASGRLDSLSPLAVLGRGYSLTRTPAGAVVTSHRQVAPGDAVRVLLREGRLDCRVDATRDRDDRPQV